MSQAEFLQWLPASCGVAGVIIAGITATIALKRFGHHRTVSDVGLALTVFERINFYWDRLDNGTGNSSYNYGQILAHFEVACALFNKNVLTEQAESILGDHIVEVFTALKTSANGKAILSLCKSSDETYDELEKFAQERFPQSLLAQAFGDQKLDLIES